MAKPSLKPRVPVPSRSADSWLVQPAVADGLFFVALGLYFWWRTNPALHYHLKAQVLYLHPVWWHRYLERPGGLLDFVAGLIMQLGAWPWLGAWLYTGLLWGVGSGFRRWLRLSSGEPIEWLRFPAILTLASLYPFYELPAVEFALMACLATWATVWLRSAAASHPSLHVLGLGLLIPAFYWIAAEKVIYLGALCACEAILARGWWRFWRGGYVVVAVWLAFGFDRWYNHANPFWDTGKVIWSRHRILMTLGVAGLLLVTLLHYVLERTRAASAATKPAPGKLHRPPRTPVWHSPPAIAAACVVLAVAAWELAVDRQRRILLELDYRAREQQWSRVVELAGRLEPRVYTAELMTAGIDTSRALFHLGRLPEAMFAFPQRKGIPLLPNTKEGFGWCISMSEIMLELGQVNYAEHWAHEALETKGERPGLLHCLALVNLAKGRPEAARVFLNVLKTHLVCGSWAAAWLRRLDEDADWAESADIGPLRARMPRTDYPATYLPTDVLLRQLLAANSRNRMAFEFLMAHYLLTQDLLPFAKELTRLSDFGFSDLPRHYEEALLIFKPPEGVRVDLTGHEIRPAARERFQDFLRQYAPVAKNRQVAQAELKPAFGGTYWYYALFGETASGPRPTERIAY